MNAKDKNEGSGLISEKQLRELYNTHDDNCISVFIPTFRAGEDVDNRGGQLRLKNLLKEVKDVLKDRKKKEREIKELLDPAYQLIDDVHFWRNQSDGLAIFLHHGRMKYYTVPVHFEEYTCVADHFYILPLIPMFNDDGTFFMLALSLKHVRLYECSRHAIAEIVIADDVPQRLEDAVGYDFEDKSLQFRSGQGGEAGAMFHGQGEGKDDKKQEIEKFFRAVDDGIMKILNKEEAPLILACIDHYYPAFKEITAYKYLYHEHISGNPDDEDPLLLHEKAWMMIGDHFKRQRRERIQKMRELADDLRTSSRLSEIVPASVDGRVDTLFIRKGSDRYGQYDPEERAVIENGQTKAGHVSLFNMAAVSTLKKNGRVYLSEEGEMPLKFSDINALMRY
jgi:hypothetical protein